MPEICHGDVPGSRWAGAGGLSGDGRIAVGFRRETTADDIFAARSQVAARFPKRNDNGRRSCRPELGCCTIPATKRQRATFMSPGAGLPHDSLPCPIPRGSFSWPYTIPVESGPSTALSRDAHSPPSNCARCDGGTGDESMGLSPVGSPGEPLVQRNSGSTITSALAPSAHRRLTPATRADRRPGRWDNARNRMRSPWRRERTC